MTSQKMLIAVLVMGAVMLALRVLPILFLKKKIKNRFLQSFLAYIPYAVLTSMTFPEVFGSTPSFISASLALAVAILLAYLDKSLIVVSLSSTATAFVVERIMEFMKH